jgi:hypothetical protein
MRKIKALGCVEPGESKLLRVATLPHQIEGSLVFPPSLHSYVQTSIITRCSTRVPNQLLP